MRHSHQRLALLLFLVALLAHAPALVGVLPGALPSTGDTIGAFTPWHEFIRRNLQQYGAIPLWNPHLYGGVPFAGNGQSALFYPPTYLHFLLPENLALWGFALLHSWFLMMGGYFLGRTLGLSRRAAFLSAVLMGLGNATPAHLFGGHLTFLPARSFWPWQAAFLIRLLRADNARFDPKNAISLAACLALGLAAGAPQIWLFGVLFCLSIALFWMVWALRNRVAPQNWPWQAGALAIGLTLLWCAPTLLPLRELKNWSSHGATLSFAEVTDLSATPRSLFRLGFNQFFGGNSFVMWSLPSNPGEDGASLGFAPLMLAMLAPFVARKSRVARAMWLGCALTLLLALGGATPLYRALYEHIGLFQITRVPARWLELWAFGAAILAGFCFDSALQNPRAARRLGAVWPVAALATLVLGAWVFWSRGPGRIGAPIVLRALQLPASRAPEIAASLQSDALLSCVVVFAILAALTMLWRRDWTHRATTALVLLAVCAEPLTNFWLSTRIAPPSVVQNAQIPLEISQKYRAGERWIVRAPFQQLNAPLSAQIDALNGYEPFGSAPFFRFAAAAQPGASFSADFQPVAMDPLWRVMGATHVLWKPKFAGDTPRGFAGKTVAHAGEWRLNSIEDRAMIPPDLLAAQEFAVDELKRQPSNQLARRAVRQLAQVQRDILKNGLKPWPRAYLTRDLRRADGPKALLELRDLASYSFQETPSAVVSSHFSRSYSAPDTLPLSQHDKLALPAPLVQTPDVQTWRLTASDDALFVQNDVMAPGWKAFVDAKPAKIHLANAIFRGVEVPGGSRVIALVYDSQTLRFGLFLALCGLTLSVFYATSRRR